jgi:glycosyltransferase involved in cell wall biosynthesis
VPDTDPPTVTVVVPVRDGPDELARCVEGLLDQDYPPDRVAVVVVDNGSAVPVASRLPAHDRLTVLREDRPGSYVARNTGVAAAQGEVVAFTDADCLPTPGWLRELVAALAAEPRADLVGGAVELVFPAGRPVGGLEWYEYLMGFPQERYLRENGFAVTANMGTWRAVLDRVGPFDAALLSGGDADWGRRVRTAGGRQRYAAAAVVRHPARVTWADQVTKHRRTTQGVIDKVLRRPGARRRLLRLLVGQFPIGLRRAVTLWRDPRAGSLADRVSCVVAGWRLSLVTAGVLAAAVVRSVRGG